MVLHTARAMALLLFCASAYPVIAQQSTTTRYIYDDNGRLRAVVSPTGAAAIYDYDPAGNITAIRRLGVDGFELLSFAPTVGAVGDRVTLYGVNIGVVVNSVTFNGVAAQVTESSPTKVVAIVPNGATTGPITLTTARGSATTATPFTVKGVSVSPSSARIFEGDRLQFTAMASTTSGDPNVRWSVNGIDGGNGAVGVISPTGLYVAPGLANNVPSAVYTVRATSVAEPDFFRDAEVNVRNLITARSIVASGVSVSVPEPGGRSATYAALGQGVSISLPTPNITPTNYSALGQGVSISLPTPNITPTNYSAFSPGVSVSVNLPSISSITPNRVARGSNATITISGVNFAGVTTLGFYTLSGAFDPAISVTNLSFAANGSSLTAIITVNGSAAIGRRLAIVATQTLPSLAIDSGATTIEITTP